MHSESTDTHDGHLALHLWERCVRQGDAGPETGSVARGSLNGDLADHLRLRDL